ncbi:lipid ABC transporter permease/ATP-binding protein, partial [Klebsiella pneumoniae]
FMLSLLQPLLDAGFGKTDRSFLLWMPLVVIGLRVLRGSLCSISIYSFSCVSGNVLMPIRLLLFGHMLGM